MLHTSFVVKISRHTWIVVSNFLSYQHAPATMQRQNISNVECISQLVLKNTDRIFFNPDKFSMFAFFIPHLIRWTIDRYLPCYGIALSVNNSVESYLSLRSFQVCVNGSLSQVAEAVSGVIQGSKIGPSLFVTYTYNFADNRTAGHLIYAGDAKLSAPIPENTWLHSKAPMATSSKGSEDWELFINPTKSEHLTQPIKIISSVWDLGLFLNTGFSAEVLPKKALGMFFLPKVTLRSFTP